MGDEEHGARLLPLAPPDLVQPPSCTKQCVACHESGDARVIAWVQCGKDAEVAHEQVGASRAEGHAALVGDIRARYADMAPPEGARPLREIVFLTIALGEHRLLEAAGAGQAIMPDKHAETMSRRYLDDAATVRLRRLRCEGAGFRQAGERIRRGGLRVAEDSRVVRERGCGADVRSAVGGIGKDRQPVACDERVAVQQHDVPAG